LGDAPRSINDSVRPPFSFPQSDEKLRSAARQSSGGRGPILRNSRAGSKAGQPGRRGTVSKNNETNKQFPSQIICDLASKLVRRYCETVLGFLAQRPKRRNSGLGKLETSSRRICMWLSGCSRTRYLESNGKMTALNSMAGP
jgi:hypothetical protein